jgi:hypothetical protein
MKRSTGIALAVVCAGLAACARDLQPPTEDQRPSSVRFEIRNQGPSTSYVYQSCTIDFAITSLANPTAPIAQVGPCVTECGTPPHTCGACFEAPLEIAAGGTATAYWLAARVTNEPTCQRLHALPDGDYRIQLPVYASHAEATAKVLPFTFTQVFTLPAPDDTVTIPIAISPGRL